LTVEAERPLAGNPKPQLDAADPVTAADNLLSNFRSLPPVDRAHVRQRVICQCAPWARAEAARLCRGNEFGEDLQQVAVLGLILAVDRFDADRGVPFRHFAVPTIAGEIKRHYRDRTWSGRVGRRMQELCQEIRRAEPALSQRLGRTPTAADMAAHLGVSFKEIQAARVGELAYRSYSLNRPAYGDTGEELGDTLGEPDPSIDSLPDLDALRRALTTLPERLRVILSLRFVDELTQRQIADRLGLSQMHVSRLINRALTALRSQMEVSASS